jgi:hypothetical protein
MKTANVLSVRDVTEEKHPELKASTRRKQIEDLLRRYPNIREAETAEIVRFLATGPHLDVGLIAGHDEFKEKVRALRTSHRRQFRPKLAETLLFVAGIAGPAAFLIAKYLLL